MLRRENDDYFLVTPAEKLRITVDDAPFVAGLMETVDDGSVQTIVLTTNIGDRIVVDREHPIRVDIDAESGEPRPYVGMHGGIEALISRSAFYELVDLAAERERDGKKVLLVQSRGETFELGMLDD